MSNNNTVKRSQKADFSVVNRERSFVRFSKDLKHLPSAMKGNKPSMEIYRPPNVRNDLPNFNVGKLNVHAKEFTMNHPLGYELQHSKSSGNVLFEHHLPHHIQHSKSSGNILRQLNPGFIPVYPTAIPIQLMPASTHSQILNHHLSGMGFRPYQELNLAQSQIFQNLNNPPKINYQPMIPNHHHQSSSQNLKRSKSLGATDSQNLMSKLKNYPKEETDLGMFHAEDHRNLKLAVEDPNQLEPRVLMDLVKVIMERIVEGIKYCEAGAKLCIAIIEREKKLTFLESLLNVCQQWYQERDKILRDKKAGDGKFTSFMWFLTEMCGQLKRHQFKEKFEILQPEITLLSILAKCCQACISLPVDSLSEIECLFFVLTSIGRDLEAELPQQLDQLLVSVRDAFLSSSCSSEVRRTLLQLIELHASNWQLSGSSVLYYYPRIR